MKNVIKIEIDGYVWSVRFLTREQIGDDNILGRTWFTHRAIDILDSLDRIDTGISLRHELTHAILHTQGRELQKEFDIEDMCNFIGWKSPMIVELCEKVLKQRFGDKKDKKE